MKQTIQNLAEIRSGYLFRNSLKDEPQGEVAVIQLRDVTVDGTIRNDGLLHIKDVGFKEGDFLRKGDVIFKAKSNYRSAAVYQEEMGRAIATVHYFIIRLKMQNIFPDFLAWLLNQDPAQQYFNVNARGTRVPIINKEVLGNLEINIPDISTQRKIVELFQLTLKERSLLEEIQLKRENLMKAYMLKIIKLQGEGV